MPLKVKAIGPDGKKTPPGGFTCYLPQVTKLYGPSQQFHLIRGWVRKALTKINGVDPGLEIVEKMIHEHTANRLKREGNGDWVEGEATTKVRRKRTWAERWDGTLAFLKVKELEKKGLSPLTIPKEAERRAKICTSGGKLGMPCPKNIPTEGENALEKAEEEKMAEMVDGRTTSLDTELGKCDACSCQLRTIVHLVPDVLLIGMEPKKYPDFCWKLKLRPSN
jgi:hypothetical protein